MELLLIVAHGLVDKAVKELEQSCHFLVDKGSSAKANFPNKFYEVTLEALPQTFIADGINDLRHTLLGVTSFGLFGRCWLFLVWLFLLFLVGFAFVGCT
jgi:hypothetical protein